MTSSPHSLRISAGYDSVFSSELIQKLGFPDERVFKYASAKDVLYTYFDRLVEEKLIPDPKDVVSGIYSVIVNDDIVASASPVPGSQRLKKKLVEATAVERRVSDDLSNGDLMSLVHEFAKLADEEKATEDAAPVPVNSA